MARNRIIFYSVFGAYQLAAFIFTLSIDPNDTMGLLRLLSFLKLFKVITGFGVLLIVADFTWSWILGIKARKEAEEAKLENNTLKAKIYDFQETRKTVPAAASK